MYSDPINVPTGKLILMIKDKRKVENNLSLEEELSKIKKLNSRTNHILKFTDGIHNYSFNRTKSTLYMRFNLTSPADIFQFEYRKDKIKKFDIETRDKYDELQNYAKHPSFQSCFMLFHRDLIKDDRFYLRGINRKGMVKEVQPPVDGWRDGGAPIDWSPESN